MSSGKNNKCANNITILGMNWLTQHKLPCSAWNVILIVNWHGQQEFLCSAGVAMLMMNNCHAHDKLSCSAWVASSCWIVMLSMSCLLMMNWHAQNELLCSWLISMLLMNFLLMMNYLLSMGASLISNCDAWHRHHAHDLIEMLSMICHVHDEPPCSEWISMFSMPWSTWIDFFNELIATISINWQD
jgi:hypothetical protein